MKIFEIPKSKRERILFLFLLSLVSALILILITGTIFAITRPKDSNALIKLGKTRTEQTQAAQVQDGDIRIFTGLGRLRIPLSNSSVLILSIAFPYQADDTDFTEELAIKIGDLRKLATDYFSSLNNDKITYLNEEEAKTEILKLFNANLRLGRIETLYFSDMMIIDGG